MYRMRQKNLTVFSITGLKNRQVFFLPHPVYVAGSCRLFILNSWSSSHYGKILSFAPNCEEDEFPIKIAFSVTISAAQQHTIKRAAIFISHRPLYVAFSRASSFDTFAVTIMKIIDNVRKITSNIVYREVL